MELIKITSENLDGEHICCAISNNGDIQVSSKKSWLKERIEEGLVFLKGDVRGKCFIEYIPCEFAWAPIEADGYTYIDCMWVSGQFKGQGYSNRLLQACIDDCMQKGSKGLAVLSSVKKQGFLSDPEYLKHKGFVKADEAPPYFELYCLPFAFGAAPPRFKDAVKQTERIGTEKGFTVFYTNQCPFTAKYVPLLEKTAQNRNAEFHAVHITTKEQAQSAPTPFTSFSLFYDGKFITHEILSEKKFEKLIDGLL